MAMSIRREIERLVGLELSATMLFNHPTIATFATYLATRLVPGADAAVADEVADDSSDSLLDSLFDSVESQLNGESTMISRIDPRRRDDGQVGSRFERNSLMPAETSLSDSTIPAVIADRARQQPDDIAYTFVDYDVDPAGISESLTWSQLYRARLSSPRSSRSTVRPATGRWSWRRRASTTSSRSSARCRPASSPCRCRCRIRRQHDERVTGALRDCTAGRAADHLGGRRRDHASTVRSTPAAAPRGSSRSTRWTSIRRACAVHVGPLPKTAYLQYTSGSTRAARRCGDDPPERHRPTSSRCFTDYFEATADGCTGGHHRRVVAALLPRHGPDQSACSQPDGAGPTGGVDEPGGVPAAAGPLDSAAGHPTPARVTAAPNFAFELAVRRTTDEDLAGLDLGGVAGMISGAERVHATTMRRFNERFAAFNLPDTAMRPSYGLAEATVYVIVRAGGRPPRRCGSTTRNCPPGMPKRCGRRGAEEFGEAGAELIGCGTPRSTTVRVVDPETRVENPAGKIGEIWVHGDNVARGYWRNPQLTERAVRRTARRSVRRAPRRDRGCAPATSASCPTASCSSSAASRTC